MISNILYFNIYIIISYIKRLDTYSFVPGNMHDTFVLRKIRSGNV